mgnify:CR=1 FL=1
MFAAQVFEANRLGARGVCRKVANDSVHSWSAQGRSPVSVVGPSGFDGLQYRVEIQAIAQVESALGAETPLQVNLNSALKELTAAARSLRSLTDYLERHPEALIYGKKIPR